MTPGIVGSVVKRHMKSTDHFISADSEARCPVEIKLTEDEALVGWYTNPPEGEAATLVFTSEAIHIVRPAKTQRLAIADITACAQPDSKVAPMGLALFLGEHKYLVPAAGSHGEEGQFKDAYNLFSVIRALLPAEEM